MSTRGSTATLPPTARDAMKRAAREKLDGKRQRLYGQALTAVDWPAGDVYPLPSELTKEQRALAHMLAAIDDYELGFPGHAYPTIPAERRRWLGLDPGGELERPFRGAPMWRRLQQVRGQKGQTHAIVDALPMARRLALIGEVIVANPTAYYLDEDCFEPQRLFAKLRGEGRTWAPAFADRVLADVERIEKSLQYLLFLALVRAKVPIAPRWDALLPVGLDDKLSIECARALPEPRRGLAASAALANLVSAYSVDYGMALLRAFPSKELTEGVWAIGAKGRLPVSELVKALRQLGKKHAIVASTLASLLAGGEAAPRLRCTKIVELKDAAKLTSVQRAQIERAGKAYDGRKLRAEAWLTKEKAGQEPTFAGRIELATVADEGGRAIYDVYEYMGDSGTIFKSKTLKVVGEIIQGSLEAKDAALGEALRTALHEARRPKRRAK